MFIAGPTPLELSGSCRFRGTSCSRRSAGFLRHVARSRLTTARAEAGFPGLFPLWNFPAYPAPRRVPGSCARTSDGRLPRRPHLQSGNTPVGGPPGSGRSRRLLTAALLGTPCVGVGFPPASQGLPLRCRAPGLGGVASNRRACRQSHRNSASPPGTTRTCSGSSWSRPRRSGLTTSLLGSPCPHAYRRLPIRLRASGLRGAGSQGRAPGSARRSSSTTPSMFPHLQASRLPVAIPT